MFEVDPCPKNWLPALLKTFWVKTVKVKDVEFCGLFLSTEGGPEVISRTGRSKPKMPWILNHWIKSCLFGKTGCWMLKTALATELVLWKWIFGTKLSNSTCEKENLICWSSLNVLQCQCGRFNLNMMIGIERKMAAVDVEAMVMVVAVWWWCVMAMVMNMIEETVIADPPLPLYLSV